MVIDSFGEKSLPELSFGSECTAIDLRQDGKILLCGTPADKMLPYTFRFRSIILRYESEFGASFLRPTRGRKTRP
jgi:hypothetical protein